MNLRNYHSATQRRKALEENLKIHLPHIGQFSLDEKQAAAKNCENMIGAVQVPIGICGPLKINSAKQKQKPKSKNYYVPLATTEGALVASVSRGCKAITESGGVTVMSKRIGITRAPVFAVENLAAGKKLIDWIEENVNKLKEIIESTSTHLTLLDIKSWQIGKNVFLRFRCDSQDAMGMNMITIAVTKAAEFIEQQTSARLVSISGNMCVDKKPNALNFLEGRGISVWAEAEISQEIVTSVLKTNVKDIVEVAQRKIYLGSILSHSIGANAHAVNILAAIFLATGQDIAHVAECASAITTVEITDKQSLYITIYLPDLVVGTVGGGTELPTQKEALAILGISGGDSGQNAIKLAEIIGAAVLAGELSLLASLAENSLAKAHQRLGREK